MKRLMFIPPYISLLLQVVVVLVESGVEMKSNENM